MILCATVANLDWREATKRGQESGLSGTVYTSSGFGPWGAEVGVTMEFAGSWTHTRAALFFVLQLLGELGQQCAYVTLDGRDAALLYQDGRVEAMDGYSRASDNYRAILNTVFNAPVEKGA